MGNDLKAAQFLCSRICHDLIGPAGAVNTGMELLAEESGGADGALALVTDSASQVSRRLAFFRVAFGAGGATGPSAVSDARKLAMDYLSGGKVVLDWPLDQAQMLDGELAADEIKLLMVMVFLAAEMLPRGGTVSMRAARLDGGVGIAFIAGGPGARVREGVGEAIAGPVAAEHLSAQSIIGDFARRLSGALGAEIEIAEGGMDEVRLAVMLTPAGASVESR